MSKTISQSREKRKTVFKGEETRTTNHGIKIAIKLRSFWQVAFVRVRG